MWLIGMMNKLVIEREDGKYSDFRGLFDNSILTNGGIHEIAVEGYSLLPPLITILNNQMGHFANMESGSATVASAAGADVMTTLAMVASDLMKFIYQKRDMACRWARNTRSNVSDVEPRMLSRAKLLQRGPVTM